MMKKSNRNSSVKPLWCLRRESRKQLPRVGFAGGVEQGGAMDSCGFPVSKAGEERGGQGFLKDREKWQGRASQPDHHTLPQCVWEINTCNNGEHFPGTLVSV